MKHHTLAQSYIFPKRKNSCYWENQKSLWLITYPFIKICILSPCQSAKSEVVGEWTGAVISWHAWVEHIQETRMFNCFLQLKKWKWITVWKMCIMPWNYNTENLYKFIKLKDDKTFTKIIYNSWFKLLLSKLKEWL